jgi:hypothetical protein
VAYDRSDAREQRRNELAARLAEVRARVGHRKDADWRGAGAPLAATALLLVTMPDAVLFAMGRSPPIFSTALKAGAGLVEAIERSPPFNDPPTAEGAPELSTAGPMQLTLSGHDPEGAPLTVTIVRPPAHGELVVPDGAEAPLLVEYRPTAGFSGDDAFAFVVDDGVLQSPVAERVLRVYAPAPRVERTMPRSPADGRRVGRDFDPRDPSSWRDARVTPEYLQRAEQVLDGRERDTLPSAPSLMPPLIPSAELERGAR